MTGAEAPPALLLSCFLCRRPPLPVMSHRGELPQPPPVGSWRKFFSLQRLLWVFQPLLFVFSRLWIHLERVALNQLFDSDSGLGALISAQ